MHQNSLMKAIDKPRCYAGRLGWLMLVLLMVPAAPSQAEPVDALTQVESVDESTPMTNSSQGSTDHEKMVPTSPDKLISVAVEELLAEITQIKGEQKNLDFYYALVERSVSDLVDFPLIARRVMGRHYKAASEAERDAFTKVFRESLLMTYAKGVSGYNGEELVFLPFKGVNTRNDKTRAKVEMEIRAGEQPILVVYQMFLRDDKWKVENIVLNGVNLGLTFRNQFSEAFTSNKGDYAAVIADWGRTDDAQQ